MTLNVVHNFNSRYNVIIKAGLDSQSSLRLDLDDPDQ